MSSELSKMLMSNGIDFILFLERVAIAARTSFFQRVAKLLQHLYIYVCTVAKTIMTCKVTVIKCCILSFGTGSPSRFKSSLVSLAMLVTRFSRPGKKRWIWVTSC